MIQEKNLPDEDDIIIDNIFTHTLGELHQLTPNLSMTALLEHISDLNLLDAVLLSGWKEKENKALYQCRHRVTRS